MKNYKINWDKMFTFSLQAFANSKHEKKGEDLDVQKQRYK